MRADELIVDSFAGGGGASLGIEWGAGPSFPDLAINHDVEALAMHEANHPECRHVREDVWRANLRELVGGRKVGLLWASPDCKHFSRAKGAKPVEKSIRSLAWVCVRWASQVHPRVIILENVREFADWGPLVPQWTCACGWKGTEGQATLARTRRRCPRCESLRIKPTLDMVPDPLKKGLTFRLFCNRLRGLGYRVEWKTLDAADYGAPTHRRRLFLIARCDGAAIEWPEPTHTDPKKLDAAPLFARLSPWRTAAECIDWSIPCPSIFTRKRTLAEKTLRRIALGIRRYVLDNPTPFLVPITHNGERRCHGLDEPAPTVTTAHRGEHAIVAPLLSKYHHAKGDKSRCQPVDDPASTLDTQPRFGLVTPYLVQRYGEREGQEPRTVPVDRPLGVVVPTGNCGDLVTPILVGAGGSEYAAKPRGVDEPFPTAKCDDRRALVAAYLAKHFGGMVGVPIDTPLPTSTSIATQNQIVAANLVRMSHGQKQWNAADEPAPTITTQHNHIGLVASNLVRFNHDDAGVPIDEPAPSVTTTNHAALVYSFLVKYFGTAIAANLFEPAPTATSKHRFGLVTVTIAGELYVIVDIGMRMLAPRELAAAQGFPTSYVLTGTKTSQVAKIGNSVCPPIAAALARANCLQEVAVA